MEKQLVRNWNTGYIVEHWVRVFSIAVLTVTGLSIHRPFIAGGSEILIMAWMRFFHFIAAYALILGLVVRIYMALRSTFDSDWKDFVSIDNFKNLPDILGYYLFLKSAHRDYRRYNPLQVFAYLSVAVMIILAMLTGAALYHGRLFGFIKSPDSFLWVNALFGGESWTRVVHILAMWYFIVFTLIHAYMAFMTGWVNKDKSFTAIITGYKLKKR